VRHFVDFLMFLVVSLGFANGSQGTISYLANGDRSFSKPVEVFGGSAVPALEDFRRLELVRDGKKQTMRSHWRQDKGHRGECDALANAIREGQAVPIPFDQIVRCYACHFAYPSSVALGRPMSTDVAALVSSVLNSTASNESSDHAKEILQSTIVEWPTQKVICKSRCEECEGCAQGSHRHFML
jgi:predicted dehydrogenase